MMENLQWPTLEHRQKNQMLTSNHRVPDCPWCPWSHSNADFIPHLSGSTNCNHPYKFKCILASTTAHRNCFPPEQSPSGMTLTKKPPRRLPSTASSVACTSPLLPFVDVILRVSTTIQMQILQCFDTAGWVSWLIKTRPRYNVFGGMLNLTQPTTQPTGSQLQNKWRHSTALKK